MVVFYYMYQKNSFLFLTIFEISFVSLNFWKVWISIKHNLQWIHFLAIFWVAYNNLIIIGTSLLSTQKLQNKIRIYYIIPKYGDV